MTRTCCRFGLNRRFVATIEWLRLWPNEGFFPQMAQIFDMGRGSVPGLRLSLRGSGGAELREQVGHLERAADGLGALVDARLGLLGRVAGQDAERDRDAGLERRQLETA